MPSISVQVERYANTISASGNSDAADSQSKSANESHATGEVALPSNVHLHNYTHNSARLQLDASHCTPSQRNTIRTIHSQDQPAAYRRANQRVHTEGDATNFPTHSLPARRRLFHLDLSPNLNRPVRIHGRSADDTESCTENVYEQIGESREQPSAFAPTHWRFKMFKSSKSNKGNSLPKGPSGKPRASTGSPPAYSSPASLNVCWGRRAPHSPAGSQTLEFNDRSPSRRETSDRTVPRRKPLQPRPLYENRRAALAHPDCPSVRSHYARFGPLYGRLDVLGSGVARIERHLSSSCGNIDHWRANGVVEEVPAVSTISRRQLHWLMLHRWLPLCSGPPGSDYRVLDLDVSAYDRPRPCLGCINAECFRSLPERPTEREPNCDNSASFERKIYDTSLLGTTGVSEAKTIEHSQQDEPRPSCSFHNLEDHAIDSSVYSFHEQSGNSVASPIDSYLSDKSSLDEATLSSQSSGDSVVTPTKRIELKTSHEEGNPKKNQLKKQCSFEDEAINWSVLIPEEQLVSAAGLVEDDNDNYFNDDDYDSDSSPDAEHSTSKFGPDSTEP